MKPSKSSVFRSQGAPGPSGPLGSPLLYTIFMGGELSKREGVLFRSFQSEARSFCYSFYRFAQIYFLITISLLDIGFKW